MFKWLKRMVPYLRRPSPLELTAYHEAGHAVSVVNDRWHFLRSDVTISKSGHGATCFQLDQQLVKRDIQIGKIADLDFPLLKAAILALSGICAEIRLSQLHVGPKRSFREAAQSAREDIQHANWALNQMIKPVRIDAAFHRALQVARENETHWCMVDKFAKELLDRRSIPPKEATNLILAIEKACVALHGKYQHEQSLEDQRLYADAEIRARNERLGLWRENN